MSLERKYAWQESANYINRAFNEYFRLKKWFGFLLGHYPHWQELCRNRSIVDIGCGEALNALAMLSLLPNANYHGYDYRFRLDQEQKLVSILNYAVLKDTTLFGFGFRGKRQEITYWQEIRRLLAKINLCYRGNQADASKSEFWDFLMQTAGQPGLLVLRQPDVRCQVESPDNYPKMFVNIFQFMHSSYDKNGFTPPLIITTSNSQSESIIHLLLQETSLATGIIFKTTVLDTRQFGLIDNDRINDGITIILEKS